MKIIFSIILVVIVFKFAIAQEREKIVYKIDSIVSVNKSLSQQLIENNKVLDKLNDTLLRIKYNNIELPSLEILTNTTVNVFSEPKSISFVKMTLPQKTKITVMGYESDFYLIDYNGDKGYAHYSALPADERLIEYKTLGIIQEKKQKEQKEKKELEQNKKREQLLIKEFGINNAKRIMNGEIWLGMTSDMAIKSIGLPNENNRTIGSWGVHEQWVYEFQYLYFENDKLVSWQD